jgi:hypothetical protein
MWIFESQLLDHRVDLPKQLTRSSKLCFLVASLDEFHDDHLAQKSWTKALPSLESAPTLALVALVCILPPVKLWPECLTSSVNDVKIVTKRKKNSEKIRNQKV